jgi:polyphosphate kinase
VKVQIIVRGICGLKPQVKGLSENIEGISIVDRFLEHTRVFIFHNDGNEEIYLSSADFMTRNLSNRVETAFPIFDEKLKRIVKDVIDIQLKDNVKSRIINAEQNNTYRRLKSDFSVRAQIETYFYMKNLTEEYHRTNDIPMPDLQTTPQYLGEKKKKKGLNV